MSLIKLRTRLLAVFSAVLMMVSLSSCLSVQEWFESAVEEQEEQSQQQ